LPSGLAIGKNAHTVHLSVAFEKLAQFIFSGIEAEIPDENVFQVAPLSANRGETPETDSGFTRVRKRAESIANPRGWASEDSQAGDRSRIPKSSRSDWLKKLVALRLINHAPAYHR
jgi:hypothetical protein